MANDRANRWTPHAYLDKSVDPTGRRRDMLSSMLLNQGLSTSSCPTWPSQVVSMLSSPPPASPSSVDSSDLLLIHQLQLLEQQQKKRREKLLSIALLSSNTSTSTSPAMNELLASSSVVGGRSTHSTHTASNELVSASPAVKTTINNKRKSPTNMSLSSLPLPEKRLKQQPMCQEVSKSSSKPYVRVFPCRARGFKNSDGSGEGSGVRHNESTAVLRIRSDAPHGTVVVCSHKACADSGRRFRWCAVCQQPVAKRNFMKRHCHGIITSARYTLGDYMHDQQKEQTPDSSASAEDVQQV